MARRAEAGWQVLSPWDGARAGARGRGSVGPGTPRQRGRQGDLLEFWSLGPSWVSHGALLAFLSLGSAAPGAAESGGDWQGWGRLVLRIPGSPGALWNEVSRHPRVTRSCVEMRCLFIPGSPRHGLRSLCSSGVRRCSVGSLVEVDTSEEGPLCLALARCSFPNPFFCAHLGLLEMELLLRHFQLRVLKASM